MLSRRRTHRLGRERPCHIESQPANRMVPHSMQGRQCQLGLCRTLRLQRSEGICAEQPALLPTLHASTRLRAYCRRCHLLHPARAQWQRHLRSVGQRPLHQLLYCRQHIARGARLYLQRHRIPDWTVLGILSIARQHLGQSGRCIGLSLRYLSRRSL